MKPRFTNNTLFLPIFVCILVLLFSSQYVFLYNGVPSREIHKKPHLPLCLRDQVQRGVWITAAAHNNHTETLPYRSTKWEESCYSAADGHKEYSSSASWTVPEPCQLTTWDPALLCRLLENKTLGFLGDSISWQIFRSMKYLLGAVPTMETKVREEFQFCPNNSTTIFWSRNNKLDVSDVEQMIHLYQPDIIVANRGAWYDSNDVFFPKFNETLHIFQQWLAENEKHVFVWRTTAPGIPQCESFHSPQTHSNETSSFLTTMEQHVESLPWYLDNEKRKGFHWWEFRAQNALVEETILQSLGMSTQLEFLDTYHWYIQHPNLHIGMHTTNGDCLHHCLPGVPDEKNRLLLHLLQRRSVDEQSRVSIRT